MVDTVSAPRFQPFKRDVPPGALWAVCRSPYRTVRCTFSPFCALRFQCLTAKAPQEPCERGAVLRTGLLDALFPVLGIEISVSHSQSVSGALWVGCRSPYRTFRCTFSPFCALRFQRLTAKVSQEPCGWGTVLRTGLLDALFPRFVH